MSKVENNTKCFIGIIGSLLMLTLPLWGQQQAQFTQFMHNKLALNPGYVGSDDGNCVTALYRGQWLGLDGAPETQLLSLNSSLLNRRIGLGVLLRRHSIGISKQLSVEASYAYRVRLGRGSIGVGLQASARHFRMDYSDPRLKADRPISSDGGIAVGENSKVVPNFGIGVHYQTPRFYMGVGVPRLIRNSIDFNTITGLAAREVIHLYFMSGIKLKLNELVTLHPQLLLKYVPQLPMDADIHLSFEIVEQFMAGVSYRLGGGREDFGESVDVLLAAQLTAELLFGLSYDITISELKDYSKGSAEAVLRYCFGRSVGEDIANPRFF